MADTDDSIQVFSEAVGREKRKITRELKRAKISGYKMKILEPIIQNCAWMRVKLDEVREDISLEKITVEYDNGGGQKGIRKNPIFDGYEALWKSYMLGMGRILDCIPDRDEAEEALKVEETRPSTVLDQIRAKQRDTS